MAARIIVVTEDEYHNDPCETPSLSSSTAKALVDGSELHAWQEHPRLGGTRREPTKSLDLGTLVHRLVLGKGAELYEIDAPDFRTKAAREERDAARDRGELPVLSSTLEEGTRIADAVNEQLVRAGIKLGGESEVTIVWQEQAEGAEVLCRSRLDHLDGATIYDLKICRSSHPRACASHVVEYGYDIQRAAYISALETLRPELAGRVDFVHLFVESSPPYALSPYRLDGLFRLRGEQRWADAVRRWNRALRENDWPAYVRGIGNLEAPRWVAYQMQEGL